MKNLYLILGQSGVGKSTLAETLKEKYGLETVHSYTTRPARFDGEIGHIFLTDEEFDNLPELAAYTEFNGFRYGITKDILNKADTYVIDIAGAEMLAKRYTRPLVKIGIILSEPELKERMKKRGDTDEMIMSRLEHDKVAFKNLFSFCDILVSGSFEPEQMADIVYQKMKLYEN